MFPNTQSLKVMYILQETIILDCPLLAKVRQANAFNNLWKLKIKSIKKSWACEFLIGPVNFVGYLPEGACRVKDFLRRLVVSICIGVLCVHMFICVVYTQSTCPFQLHQASVGSRPILLFIACESCVIYCDRHPVFSKMVNSQYRDWIVEKFICICVKSAQSK